MSETEDSWALRACARQKSERELLRQALDDADAIVADITREDARAALARIFETAVATSTSGRFSSTL